jgi:hypothetical protein
VKRVMKNSATFCLSKYLLSTYVTTATYGSKMMMVMNVATATLLRRVNNRIIPSLVCNISGSSSFENPIVIKGVKQSSAGGVRVLSSSSSKVSPSRPTKDVTQEAIDKSERLHIELTEVKL